MPWKVTSAPATEPVTTAEAKLHLNIPTAVTDWDTLIEELIKSATSHVEDLTSQCLITQTLQEYRDNLDELQYFGEITLARYPVSAITHIKYTDTAGAQQTWDSANYRTDLVSRRPRIALATAGTLPTTTDEVNSIEIQYIAGYGNAAAVPAEFKTAIKLLVAEMFENRENRAYTLPDRLH
ncbi:MAG: hypothetical protein E6R03_08205, partial [Hyphomicrobiaceae bacterium]